MTTTVPHPIWCTYESPFGALTLVGDADGLEHLYFPGRAPLLAEDDRVPAALAVAATQLDEYFAGDRRSFDLPLALAGTPFQRQVWAALEAIPYGTTTTYGALARVIGRDRARGIPEVRAVAAAIAATPTPIVIPCHRVVAADGSLTGYLGGLQRKEALLAFEAAGGDHPTLAARWVRRQLSLL